MDQRGLVVCLVGFPGVGKLTIARALASKFGAVVVDNHWINDPILRLVTQGDSEPVSQAAWPQVAKVQAAVLDTIATIAPRERSYIFTYAGSDEDPADRRAFEEYRSVAARRGSRFVPVRLLCKETELVKRVQGAERRGKKLTDIKDAINNTRFFTPLDPRLPGSLDLDVSDLEPEATAVAIIQHIKALT